MTTATKPPRRWQRRSKYDWSPLIDGLKKGLVVYIEIPKRVDPFSFRQLCYQKTVNAGLTAWTQLCENGTKVAVWVPPAEHIDPPPSTTHNQGNTTGQIGQVLINGTDQTGS